MEHFDGGKSITRAIERSGEGGGGPGNRDFLGPGIARAERLRFGPKTV